MIFKVGDLVQDCEGNLHIVVRIGTANGLASIALANTMGVSYDKTYGKTALFLSQITGVPLPFDYLFDGFFVESPHNVTRLTRATGEDGVK